MRCEHCGGLVLREVDYIPGLGRVPELKCSACARVPDAGPSQAALDQLARDASRQHRYPPSHGGARL